MPLRLPTANECRRADGPRDRPERVKTQAARLLPRCPSLRAVPLHRTLSPPHAMQPHESVYAPCSPHFATSLLPPSRYTLRAHFGRVEERAIEVDMYRALGQKNRRAGSERSDESARLYAWDPNNRSRPRHSHWGSRMPTPLDAWHCCARTPLRRACENICSRRNGPPRSCAQVRRR